MAGNANGRGDIKTERSQRQGNFYLYGKRAPAKSTPPCASLARNTCNRVNTLASSVENLWTHVSAPFLVKSSSRSSCRNFLTPKRQTRSRLCRSFRHLAQNGIRDRRLGVNNVHSQKIRKSDRFIPPSPYSLLATPCRGPKRRVFVAGVANPCLAPHPL